MNDFNYSIPMQPVMPTANVVPLNSDIIASELNTTAAVTNTARRKLSTISIDENSQPIKVHFNNPGQMGTTVYKKASELIPWLISYFSTLFVDIESMIIDSIIPAEGENIITGTLIISTDPKKHAKIPTTPEGNPLKTTMVVMPKAADKSDIATQIVQGVSMATNEPFTMTTAAVDILSEILVDYDINKDWESQKQNYISCPPVSEDVSEYRWNVAIHKININKILRKMIFKSVEGDPIDIGWFQFYTKPQQTMEILNTIVMFNITKRETFNQFVIEIGRGDTINSSSKRSYIAIDANGHLI